MKEPIADGPFIGIRVSGRKVEHVIDDSPAAVAGVTAGCELVAIDGTSVDAGTNLQELVKERAPGEYISLSLLCDGKEVRRSVQLGSKRLHQLRKNSPRLGEEFDFGSLELPDNIIPNSFAGKTVIVSFWATWCAPCKSELVMLQMLAEKYVNSNVVWLCVSIDENRRSWSRFVTENCLGGVQIRDPKLAASMGITTVPKTYIVDRSGVIRFESNRYHTVRLISGIVAKGDRSW
jgi:thiol-disulfide isomerase/thioredoxin